MRAICRWHRGLNLTSDPTLHRSAGPVSASEKHDITQSLWHQSCREAAPAAPFAGRTTADLVVIGGGYTGLSAALHAARAGADVRLIEAGQFGQGGSGRNVGLVNAGLWLPPEKIAARVGAQAGQKLSAALAAAPDLVFDLIADFAMSCEPVRGGTLHCAHSSKGMRELETRQRQLRAIGAPVTLLDRHEAVERVGSSAVHGALFDPRAGTIHPLAYARGLARAAIACGAQLHEHSPATALEHSDGMWQITTPQGQIRAAKLIVATNAYALPVAGLTPPQIVPVHYVQAATAPLSPEQIAGILPGGEGCWDTATVMSSWRRDNAGRLIIGGMGGLHHPARGAHTGWLHRKLAQLFPALAGAALSPIWHGRIGMSGDYLPQTQALGSGPHQGYVTFGYSGRGIGPGTLFGKAMAEALIHEDTTVLPRAPAAAQTISNARIKEAFYETGATLTHLIKDRI